MSDRRPAPPPWWEQDPPSGPANPEPRPYAPPVHAEPLASYGDEVPFGVGPSFPAEATVGGIDPFFDTAPLDTYGRPVPPPRRARTGILVATALVVGLLAGLVGGLAGGWVQSRHDNTLTDPGASLGAPPSGGLSRPADSVAGIAARVLPVVVSIDVRSSAEGGTGSGFVVRSDGYILTNNHVVAAAGSSATITVTFNDGSKAPGTVVGTSPSYDLAVVKVHRTGLPVAVLGDSDAVVVGDQVIAVGSPLGLAGTVTTGIISATHRPVTTGTDDGSGRSYLSALQTDAAINPGNSGGPLVDGQGRVIGVNSAIATLSTGGSRQSGSIGLGFSIPVNQARRVAEQLIRQGYATYPVIGATLDQTYQGGGVLLDSVRAGGPSAAAGLQPEDVVRSVDGAAVDAPEDLIVDVRAKAPGDTVRLQYSRGSTTRTVVVTLGEARG
jgi:putative serine protease PepD